MNTRAEQCAHCYFCEKLSKPEFNAVVTICRLQPRSAASLVMMQTLSGKPEPRWIYTTYWDQVEETDWCSKFQAREAH